MIRKTIIALTGIAILATLNFSIWQNEDLLENGDIVYLELAPVDPRSLIQGDFMRLNYRLNGVTGSQDANTVILTLDARRVATEASADYLSTMQPGEMRMLWHRVRKDKLQVRPDTFLFQEGAAEDYARARFARFHVGEGGRALLTGLADKDLNLIRPGKTE